MNAPPPARDPSNLVNVMQLPPVQVTRINYLATDDLFAGARFIRECGQKLDSGVLTVATASVLFHRFFKVAKKSNHDQYLIAAACLYVAGKLEEQLQLKIRDLINVAHTTLHRGSEPLGLDSQYYNMRDAICQAELLVLRMVGFKASVEHPHKYLLHYLRSLRDWMSVDVWQKYPIARTSWAILQDFYHDPRVADLGTDGGKAPSGSDLSLACIALSLQAYGISVPYVGEGDAGRSSSSAWYNAFSPHLTKERLWEVMGMLMEAYNGDDRAIKPFMVISTPAAKT